MKDILYLTKCVNATWSWGLCHCHQHQKSKECDCLCNALTKHVRQTSQTCETRTFSVFFFEWAWETEYMRNWVRPEALQVLTPYTQEEEKWLIQYGQEFLEPSTLHSPACGCHSPTSLLPAIIYLTRMLLEVTLEAMKTNIAIRNYRIPWPSRPSSP